MDVFRFFESGKALLRAFISWNIRNCFLEQHEKLFLILELKNFISRNIGKTFFEKIQENFLVYFITRLFCLSFEAHFVMTFLWFCLKGCLYRLKKAMVQGWVLLAHLLSYCTINMKVFVTCWKKFMLKEKWGFRNGKLLWNNQL